MSEHRRKPPQPQGGGRAAARRAAQQPPGRRAAPSQEATTASSSSSHEEERPYSGRAEARRAAQRGSRRRAADGGPGGPGGPGRSRQPSKKHVIDYPRHDRYGWRRWVPSWKLSSGMFIGFAGAVVAVGGIGYAVVQVPDPSLASQAQNNVYYWADGKPMVSTGGEINRQIIPIEKIPKAMQYAVVSAENKSFYEDSGVDPMGISRALFNMAKGGETQGGSTITQQYVKNAMLADQSQTFSRKFKELFVSIKVGTEMNKSDILAGYLNTSYYGRGAYGLQAAARTYYGKDAEKLNPSQCALLASLLKGPTYFDPAGATDIDPKATSQANTRRVTERWDWILGEMVKDHHLTAAERAKYPDFPTPQGLKKNAQLGGQIGYLVDLAKRDFVNNNDLGVTADDLLKGGYEIHTTFDRKKVQELEKAITKIYDKDLDPKKRVKDEYVQFGGASVEPATGKLVAVYGGRDATKHFTNNADQTNAQVGSTFKPFVLAAAMRDGVRDPDLGQEQSDDERTPINPDKTRYNGVNKLKIKNYDGTVWTDENGNEWLQRNDGDESPEPDHNISLREAMRKSFNAPFVQQGMDVGIPQVRQAAIDAGLKKESLIQANVPSFSIGISSPSALRMAGAYGTFAQGGEQRDPYSVTEVEREGKVVYKHKDRPKRPFAKAVADNVTDVLKTVVEEGTGTNAQLPGREVAGKTGTTDDNKSAWFVGYTPQLSTAIDMFRQDDSAKGSQAFLSMYGTGGQESIHGASYPSEIWADYMGAALKGQPAKDFPKPEPIGEAWYGGGAHSPTPTPTETVTESPSESPSETASETPKDPTPSNTEEPCDHFFGCGDGGDDNGGDNTGDNGPGGFPGGPGGMSPPVSPSDGNATDGADGSTDGSTDGADDGSDSGGNGNGSGNGNGNGNGSDGGIFGPNG